MLDVHLLDRHDNVIRHLVCLLYVSLHGLQGLTESCRVTQGPHIKRVFLSSATLLLYVNFAPAWPALLPNW